MIGYKLATIALGYIMRAFIFIYSFTCTRYMQRPGWEKWQFRSISFFDYEPNSFATQNVTVLEGKCQFTL